MEYLYQRTYPLTQTPDREESRPWNIDVYASPVTHAAAENRPDLLKALLERGFDDTPMCRFSLRPWHSTKNHVPALDWEDAVPLALTLLMGHTQCAQLLLEQGVPDVENIPGVSRSLYLCWREADEDYRQTCRLLPAHCTLVIERDAISPATEEKIIRFLLKHVTLLPAPAHGGISGLTQAILRCGNMGLLRKALQTGIIPPEESTPQLLAYQKNHGISLSLRPVLLTTSRPHR